MPDGRFVIDYQQGFPAGFDLPGRRTVRRVIYRLAMIPGKVNANRRAHSDFRIDADLTAGLTGEAIHHREAKPGALSDGFGREERLEHAFDHLRLHVGAGMRRAAGLPHVRVCERPSSGAQCAGSRPLPRGVEPS